MGAQIGTDFLPHILWIAVFGDILSAGAQVPHMMYLYLYSKSGNQRLVSPIIRACLWAKTRIKQMLYLQVRMGDRTLRNYPRWQEVRYPSPGMRKIDCKDPARLGKYWQVLDNPDRGTFPLIPRRAKLPRGLTWWEMSIARALGEEFIVHLQTPKDFRPPLLWELWLY